MSKARLKTTSGVMRASLTRREGEPDILFHWTWTAGADPTWSEYWGGDPGYAPEVEIGEARYEPGGSVVDNLTDAELNDLEALVWEMLAEMPAEKED